jgi:hypothetical protein
VNCRGKVLVIDSLGEAGWVELPEEKPPTDLIEEIQQATKVEAFQKDIAADYPADEEVEDQYFRI